MKKYFRLLTGSLLFRVFAPIVLFSIIFTFVGAKLLYDSSLKDLTALNESSAEGEVKRAYYITESKFTTLFLTHGADPAMYNSLVPSIKKEVLAELDKFADHSKYCYSVFEKSTPILDTCKNNEILQLIRNNQPIKQKGTAYAKTAFSPWQWEIIIYTDSSHFEQTVAQNTRVIALSIGAFTAAILFFFVLVFYIMVRRPFNTLLGQLKKIENGTYEPLDLYSSREMHHLVNGINHLGQSVKNRTEELVEANRVLNDRVKEETAKNMESARIIYEHQRHLALNSMLMNIAHHWRQPLNVISLMIQDIQEEVENGTISKEYIDNISEKALKELQGMSNTISRFTKLYENAENVNSVNLFEQCRHAVEYIRNILGTAESEIDINVPEDLEIFATERDILELFIKLLDNTANAVKVRNIPSVQIRISAVSINEGTIIVIEDNAGGISSEILGSVFEPYTTTSFKQKNKGLGLYLIKRLLEEKYAGSIKAENARNGTRITIFIKNIL